MNTVLGRLISQKNGGGHLSVRAETEQSCFPEESLSSGLRVMQMHPALAGPHPIVPASQAHSGS